MIKIFIDLETTGTDVKKHSIHQIAGLIEINGILVEDFNFKTAPHPKAICEPEAMRICKVTEDQIRGYNDMVVVHGQFIKMLSKYINRYDKKDKAYMIGFNNRSFDDVFLRSWFEQCSDMFFGSWFWSDSLDCLVLASQYLLDRRAEMPSFQLLRVATELGIEVDKDKVHDAVYDVSITRQIYRIVTGLEIEL